VTPAGPTASFDARPDGSDSWLIEARGEIDLANRDDFQAAVDRALGEAPERLAFDLGDVRFMDSSGLAVLVSAVNTSTAIEIRAASQIVRRVIEASGLADVLVISP